LKLKLTYNIFQIFEEWQIIEYFVVNMQREILHCDINKSPITLEVNRPNKIESRFIDSRHAKGKIE